MPAPSSRPVKRTLQEVSVNTPTRGTKREKRDALPSTPAHHHHHHQPPPTPVTPRFSTTFKTFADKRNTEGVHKSRCPCIVIKELQRELRSVDEGSARGQEIREEIAQLRKKGCSHLSVKTLTKEDLRQNVAKVQASTLHGKSKRVKEVVAAQQEGRRGVSEEEEAARRGLADQKASDYRRIEEAQLQRLAVAGEESLLRAALEEDATGDDFHLLVRETLHVGEREVIDRLETRIRTSLEALAACGIDETASRAALMADERIARGQHTSSLFRSLLLSLEVAETTLRQAVLKGEHNLRRRASEAERLQGPRAVLQQHEAASRRVLAADEHFEAGELRCAAASSAAAAVEAEEARVRFSTAPGLLRLAALLSLHASEGVGRARLAEEGIRGLVTLTTQAASLAPGVLEADEAAARGATVAAEAAEREAGWRSFCSIGCALSVAGEEVRCRTALCECYWAGLLHLRGGMDEEQRRMLERECVSSAAVHVASPESCERQVLALAVHPEGVARAAVAGQEAAERAHGRSMLAAATLSVLSDACEPRSREAVAAQEHRSFTALLACFAASGGVAITLTQERCVRAGIEAEHSSALVRLVAAEQHALRTAVEQAEAIAYVVFTNAFMAEGGLVFMRCCEVTGRRNVRGEEAWARQGLLRDLESLSRRDIAGCQHAAWQDIAATHNVAAGAMMLAGVEAEDRAEVVREEAAEAMLIAVQYTDDTKLLFANADDFRLAKQHLNGREVLMKQPLWSVPDNRVLGCAANDDMMSLLQHATRLIDATDHHWQALLDRQGGDMGRIHAELGTSRAEVSRLRGDLERLDHQFRSEHSAHTRLKAAHKVLKERCEALDKNSRSTAAANEKYRLEKRIKDLEGSLATAQNALDKERRRNARKA